MDREIGHVRLGWDIREIADVNDVDDDDMMVVVNCFCELVDQWNVSSLYRLDQYQRAWP